LVPARGQAPLDIVRGSAALAKFAVSGVGTLSAGNHSPVVHPVVTAPSTTPVADTPLDAPDSPPARPAWEKDGFGAAQ